MRTHRSPHGASHSVAFRPLPLLAALGLLACTGSALAVDTTEWVCKSCPYPKGASGSVEAGVAAVSDASQAFGTYTGLQRQGAHLLLDGDVLYRGENGYAADASFSRLGLDTRSLSARAGRDGQYALTLGYSEIPRRYGDGSTPFQGVGGNTLTLPAGYPAAGTSTMPLATTLQSTSTGIKKSRLELSAALLAIDNLTLRLGYSHDVRDGTKPVWGSFFSSSSQLVAPVDHTTDEVKLTAAYATQRVQGSVTALVSRFQNGNTSLTWANPFWPVVPGATRGQLALAPDNQLQQLSASLGLQLTPTIRASGDVSTGRLTQNAAYLAPTANSVLAPSVPALPRSSLDGRVDFFNGNVKLSADVTPDLRLAATYARDVRNNRSPVNSYALLATDMFLDTLQRKNTPFDQTQDRLKLSADFRASDTVKLAAGAGQDQRTQPYTEVQKTRETIVWAKGGLQASEALNLSLKLQHAERNHQVYGTSIWFGLAENPLLRKYNLADRRRDSASLRAEYALSETMSLGFTADHARDTYGGSLVGLTRARSDTIGADYSATLGERTQLTAYVQAERMYSWQNGAQATVQPDWFAQNFDRFTTAGLTVQHALIPDKLNIGAEARFSRARSDVLMRTTVAEPRFPAASTSNDTIKLNASYKLSEAMWLNASFWHERLAVQDWQQGLQPDTLQNLLALGQPVPRYNINVLGVSLRYKY